MGRPAKVHRGRCALHADPTKHRRHCICYKLAQAARKSRRGGGRGTGARFDGPAETARLYSAGHLLQQIETHKRHQGSKGKENTPGLSKCPSQRARPGVRPDAPTALCPRGAIPPRSRRRAVGPVLAVPSCPPALAVLPSVRIGMTAVPAALHGAWRLWRRPSPRLAPHTLAHRLACWLAHVPLSVTQVCCPCATALLLERRSSDAARAPLLARCSGAAPCTLLSGATDRAPLIGRR